MPQVIVYFIILIFNILNNNKGIFKNKIKYFKVKIRIKILSNFIYNIYFKLYIILNVIQEIRIRRIVVSEVSIQDQGI